MRIYKSGRAAGNQKMTARAIEKWIERSADADQNFKHETMNAAGNRILKNQDYHLAVYLVLGACQYAVFSRYGAAARDGGLLSAGQWILFSWIFAGLFQGWVMILWRMELYRKTVSRRLGRRGFLVFRIGFVSLAALRFLPLIPIACLTAVPDSMPAGLTVPLIVVTTPLILWTLYSVVFHFGANRAFGGDHFDPETYRKLPLEARGPFRFIPNSMYTLALLLLYHPALFYHSPIGLAVAAAHHALVWTHYFCTEKPDMEFIYGGDEERSAV